MVSCFRTVLCWYTVVCIASHYVSLELQDVIGYVRNSIVYPITS